MINGSAISNVDKQLVLGVTIDNQLKFDVHVDNICKRLSRQIYLFRQIRNCLTLNCKIMFYNSYILPHIDYCATSWGYANKANLDKLYKFQKRMGRLILNDFNCSSNELFTTLGWLTIYERIDLLTAKLVYKCLYESAPESLKYMFVFRNPSRDQPLRNSGLDLSLPCAKTELRKKCFEYAGISIWNQLPVNVRHAYNQANFKTMLKHFILSKRIQI
jgi:hypothetical protein